MKQVIFWRIVRRSLFQRRGGNLAAGIALLVAAAAATAMLTLSLDLDAKLHREFRSYGANLTLTSRDGSALPSDTLSQTEKTLGSRAIVVPFAFAVANTEDGTPVVIAGTDFERVKRMNGWWSVTAWPEREHAVLAGAKASRLFASDPSQEFTFQGRKLHLTMAGILKTGGPEENRIYMPLDQFTAWTGVKPSLIEASFTGSNAEIEQALRSLSALNPSLEARPIRQIVEAESGIVAKMRTIIIATLVLIVVMVALCVLATLTSSVLERRRDFALMKALGSTQAMVTLLFLGEAAALGSVAALLGFAAGSAVAAWIGAINFHAAIAIQPGLLPPVFFATVLLALLSALFPLGKLQHLEPATILKGE